MEMGTRKKRRTVSQEEGEPVGWVDFGLNLLRAIRSIETRKDDLDPEDIKRITHELWEDYEETTRNIVASALTPLYPFPLQ